MENDKKHEIVKLITGEKKRLGSFNRVAEKCRVSPATISQMIAGNWEFIKPGMWLGVASRLGYRDATWNIVPGITNYRLIRQTIEIAREGREFVAISHKAGSGKSATIGHYVQSDPGGQVFVIRAREWARREFLLNLCGTLGIPTGPGYITVDGLGNRVVRFFLERQLGNPVLFIDEFDKLKPSAARYMIHFYNELEEKVACVICGTDNLEVEIKRGVDYNRKGYDELASRFGRTFIHLIGATQKDVEAICRANGLEQGFKEVFEECGPSHVKLGDKYLRVVEDLRRVRKVIRREILKTRSYEKQHVNA